MGGFSDARNEQNRRDTGRNATNHGGDHAGADARNRAAMGMGQPGGFPTGMSGATSRRRTDPTATYDMSLHNMMELAKIAGKFMGGPATTAAGMIGGWAAPDFTGYRGQGVGPGDYDPKNFMGQGLMARMQQRSGRRPIGGVSAGQGLMYRPY